MDKLVDDALLLVEQNFYFLHVGKFFDKLSKKEDLSSKNLNVRKEYSTSQIYYFNPQVIQELLKDSYGKNEQEITLYEYFVEFNAYRGICMAMVEALRLESPFKSFMQFRLHERYEDFVDILSFVRNVLSHNIHAQIRLSEKDFDGTLKRIRRMQRNPQVHFEFLYALDLPEIGSPELDYGFTCKVDFEALDEGMEFLHVLSTWDLLMLSELCFNLVLAYRIFTSTPLR
ncbi:MAG TPA: hypothetical protein CFH82_00500 [Sulfurospirillum sp. UBA12182]|jgi:hypothetical protein|nr:MAG TPA: hypothetical protein CFH82_00500 [Sulfurospirillum sp. UBA12182]